MRTLFIGRDRELAAARPALVAQKYREMATGRYAFLRGSEALFYLDATRLTGTPAVVRADGTDSIPLFGDLHLENIGSTPLRDTTIFEVTDFDATAMGPFDWDVRRAVEGLAVLDGLRADHPAAGDPMTIASSANGFLDGYLRGLTDANLGDVGMIPRRQLGEIVATQLADADGKFASRAELTKYTELVDGFRRIQRTDQLVDVVSPWDRGIDDALAVWSANRRGGPLAPAARATKDVARRLDAGVSSLALHRFYVLVAGGAGADDDLLLEMKEELDPPYDSALLGRGATIEAAYPGASDPDNAARVIAGANRLLADPAAELDLGRTTWNGVAFLVRRVTRARANLDTSQLAADLEAGRVTDAAITRLANDFGRMVGRAHGNSAPAVAPLILSAVDARARAAIVARGLSDAAQVAEDFVRFQSLLAEYGPLLGPPALAY